MSARLARRPITYVAVTVLVLAAGFGLYWFQPWRLFTNSTVNETLPELGPSSAATTQPGATASTAPPGNRLLATGTLISHEHETSGTVQLVRLADGRLQLVLARLSTSDGPDVHVWLTDQPVRAGSDGWHVFDDGRHVDLGKLKG